MKIIRDKRQNGEHCEVTMIPLLLSWKINRCNIASCANQPTTIVSGIPDAPVFGLCENHYQSFSKTKGNVQIQLEFD